jgi:hypothetical protein
MNFFPQEKTGGDFRWERKHKSNCEGNVFWPSVIPLKNLIRSNERLTEKTTGAGGGWGNPGPGLREIVFTKRNLDFPGRTESRPLAFGFVP